MNGVGPSLYEERIIYHSECYKMTTHSKNLERFVKRQKMMTVEEEDDEDEDKENTGDLRSMRSNAPTFYKDCCIICQEAGGRLHMVETIHVGQKMLAVAEKLPDKS